MTEKNASEMIQVPNTLKLKVGGGRFGGIDPTAIAKAEAALKSLSANFAEWLQDELNKLEASRARIKSEGLTAQTTENLYLRAHDLKGLGSTYEFPIITRMAASLCRLIDDPVKRTAAPLFLIDAHIDAIRASVRDNIRDEAHPVGKGLAEELEAQVKAFQG
ncbi:MAG: Hpt protein [Caulobacteraceae bacterium]|nr:Hpt protein [Caulobacteraceae bacterium]